MPATYMATPCQMKEPAQVRGREILISEVNEVTKATESRTPSTRLLLVNSEILIRSSRHFEFCSTVSVELFSRFVSQAVYVSETIISTFRLLCEGRSVCEP